MDDDMFDARNGVVVSSHGSVRGDNNLFVVGWIKRGPAGIMDAKETVASIIEYINDNGRNVLLAVKESSGGSSGGRRALIRHLETNNVK